MQAAVHIEIHGCESIDNGGYVVLSMVRLYSKVIATADSVPTAPQGLLTVSQLISLFADVSVSPFLTEPFGNCNSHEFTVLEFCCYDDIP